MDFLYALFIFPIEFLLSSIYRWIILIVHNHGVALLLLSIAVNTMLIPLYHLADYWRKKEKQAQDIMHADKTVITSHYTGQERHYSLQAMYKIYHYKPFLSLRVSLGLLIQIPFFLGAYQFLSHYEALQGVSFLFLDDLMFADGLAWGYNVLPIIMTLINICNGLIYHKTIDSKELSQVWILSLVFLLLLYNAPSALVLYWTYNNLFSFVKYALINRPQYLSLIRETYRIIRDWLSRSLSKHIIIACWISACIMLVLYVTHEVRSIPSGSAAIKTALLFLILPIPALFIMLREYPLGIHIKKWNHNTLYAQFKKHYIAVYSIIILFVMLCDIVLFVDLISHTYRFATSNRIKQILAAQYILMNMVLAISFRRFYAHTPAHHNTHNSTHIHKYKNISRYAHICFVHKTFVLLILIFIIAPTLIYTTAPQEIGGSITSVLMFFLPFMLGLAGVLIVVYALFKKIRYVLSIVLAMIVISVFAYGFIIDLNLGKIVSWQFTNSAPLAVNLKTSIIEAFIWTAIGILLYRNYHTYRVHINMAFFAMLCTVVVVTGISMRNYKKIDNTTIALQPIQGSAQTQFQATLPTYTDELFAFSTQKNILVLILDGAGGEQFQTLLDEHPDLSAKLQGFTWYQNTISTSPATYSSIAAMVRGHDFTIERFNEKNMEKQRLKEPEQTASEAIFDAWTFWGNALPHYAVSLLNPPDGIRYEDIANKGNAAVRDEDDFIPYWKSLEKNKHYASSYDTFFNYTYLLQLNLFRIIPIQLKQRMFNDPFLVFNIRATQAAGNQGRFLSTWPIIDLMSTLANTDAPQATLKYFWSLMTHYPFYFQDDCASIAIESVWDGTFDIFGYEEARQQTYCTLNRLSDLFAWMQDERIYDNTKIIIASDHGHTEDGNAEGKIYALLLVKDFNAQGNITTDAMLMSNADVPSLIASGLAISNGAETDGAISNGAETNAPEIFLEIEADPTKTPRQRTLRYNLGHSYWIYNHHRNLTQFDISYYIELSTGDNVSDKSTWTYIYPEDTLDK